MFVKVMKITYLIVIFCTEFSTITRISLNKRQIILPICIIINQLSYINLEILEICISTRKNCASQDSDSPSKSTTRSQVLLHVFCKAAYRKRGRNKSITITRGDMTRVVLHDTNTRIYVHIICV